MFSVVDVTDISRDSKYWVKYPNAKYKFFDANEIRETCPGLAIDYFERKFSTAPVANIVSESFSGLQIGKEFENLLYSKSL